jgi:predicted DNA-binding transcriptional regulator AlpA
MNLGQLQAALEISRATALRWIGDGMPVESRKPYRFDAEAVRKWILGRGLAVEDSQPTERIHRTRAEIAAALGVSVRTISDWCQDPTFPGRPGDALVGDGHFPEQEIRDWLEKRNTAGGENSVLVNAARARDLEVSTALKLLKLQERRCQLVEVAIVQAELGRAVGLARQKLTPLPDILIRILPDTMDSRLREEYRERVARAVADACESIAMALENGDDP